MLVAVDQVIVTDKLVKAVVAVVPTKMVEMDYLMKEYLKELTVLVVQLQQVVLLLTQVVHLVTHIQILQMDML